MRLALIILIGLLIIPLGVNDSITSRSVDTDRICSLASAAYARGDYGALERELEAQFDVNQSEIRIKQDGVFVKTWSFFIEERGYFVARNKDADYTKKAEPSFEPVRGCLFRYRIAG